MTHPIPKVEAHKLSQPDVYYVGPPIEEGPLPAVFFFLTTAKESLTLAPTNQPVAFLSSFPLRIFSLDVPGHQPGIRPEEAIEQWIEALQGGQNFVAHFTTHARRVIDELITLEVVDPLNIGVAGISRGAFIATHLAATDERIGSVLGFAPLTRLTWQPSCGAVKENRLALSLDLDHLSPSLIHRRLRFYMGNRDEKVGTENAFQFIQSVTQSAYEHHIRSCQAELYIVPSIGHKGHGTSPETFREGAHWLAKQLTAGAP